MPDRTYTAAEVDDALQTLIEPGRLAHAQDVVTHAAPTLQRVLADALAEGGWFEGPYEAEIARAAGELDERERARAVSTLVAEQTRLGMFVGVAVGFELAHELTRSRGRADDSATTGDRGGATADIGDAHATGDDGARAGDLGENQRFQPPTEEH